MLSRLCLLMAVGCCALIAVLSHPDRGPILDPERARVLFHLAEANRTQDGTLTQAEIDDIFSDFDLDGDKRVEQLEFIREWIRQGLGDEVSAGYLFSRADTDQDGAITDMPDIQRVFGYFDLNEDGVVSEPEFVVVWSQLSS